MIRSCKYRIVRIVVIGAERSRPDYCELFEHGYRVVLVARGANFEVIAKDGVTVATPEWTRQSKVDVVKERRR